MRTFDQFLEKARELTDIRSALSVLAWDQETKMPPKAAGHRARQRATLAAIYHRKLVSREVYELLESLEQESLDEFEASSVRELRREHAKADRVPTELVQEITEVGSLAYERWVEARERSDYGIFEPWLARMMELKSREADYLQTVETRYEALLDEYEPGMSEQSLDEIFGEVRPQLTNLLRRIEESAVSKTIRPIRGDFPFKRQENLGREVLTRIGFDWDAGRLDRSPHPFCVGLSPLDVRITTRYNVNDFTGSLFGMIHEAGHALYEQGLDSARYGYPACDSVSLGIHESQSRLWENQIGRSASFWKYWFPRLPQFFPKALSNLTLDEFLLSVNQVRASLIRVEADEVTYGLHIIMRYELEKALFSGNVSTKDLPSCWNDTMDEYLGVRPANDRDGILQDTHWSQGLIGYFPTYLLGNLYAAQFLVAARKALPDLDAQIEAGTFSSLREWLREQIHRYGRQYPASELVQRVTGEPLRARYFLEYLEEKYCKLYQI
ncbi:MAG: carboxypeptidase M32 [Acidobacteriota bacterium]|nr:MAG: carboxypeptidase M32 [Acidobacteriota bacterium]